MLDQSRTPHVSPATMRRPQSSAVGGGVVSCLGCGAVIPLASASLAGVGYKCQVCSRTSQPRLAGGTGSFDLRAQHAPRSRRATQRAGSELVVIGVIVMLLGAALMPLAFWWLGAAAMIVGGVAAVIGVARRKAPY